MTPDSPETAVYEIDMNEIDITMKIGRGSYGSVYGGRWRGTAVAVKRLTLSDHMGEKAQATILKSFRREISILSILSHPNVLM